MQELIYKVGEDDKMRFLSVWLGLLEGMIRSFIQVSITCLCEAFLDLTRDSKSHIIENIIFLVKFIIGIIIFN